MFKERKQTTTQQHPRLARHAAVPPAQHLPNDKKTIEVRFHFPVVSPRTSIKNVRSWVGRRNKKQRLLLIVASLILLSLIAIAIATKQSPATRSVATTPSNPLDQLKKGTPDYPTVLPSGKSIDDLGGWTQVSPPERDPVYAYIDEVSGVAISVSQQPLPATFTSDPDSKVRDLALAQNADKTITANGKKAYIGTSKNGPQSVIFATDSLLILMKSSTAIPDDDWKTYIESLR